MFNGEEFSRGARLWTNGYDFYTPTRAYIGTYYGAGKGNRGSWRVNTKELQQSHQRMGTLLKFKASNQSKEAVDKLGKYRIGKQRSLEQYFEFSGINTMTGSVDMEYKCIQHWIQWNDEEIKNEIIEFNHKQTMEISNNMMDYKSVKREIENIENKMIDPQNRGIIVWIVVTIIFFIFLAFLAKFYKTRIKKACNVKYKFEHIV